MAESDHRKDGLIGDACEKAVAVYADTCPATLSDALSVSVLTSDGRLLYGEGEVAPAGSRRLVEAIAAKAGAMASPGDVILTNDAWFGSRRPTELVAVAPIVETGAAVAGWIEIRASVPDLGGWELGGYTPRALDTWAECVRLVPFRVYVDGKRRREAFGILDLNSRTPRLVRGVVTAMADGALAAASVLSEGGWQQAQGRAESLLEEALPSLRDGLAGAKSEAAVGRGEATVPGAARETSAATVTVEAGEAGIVVSFADVPPKQRSPVNASEYMIREAVLAAVADALGVAPEEVAWSDRLVEIRFPDGSSVGAPEGSPVGYGHFTACRAVFDAVSDALRSHMGPTFSGARGAPAWLSAPDHLVIETGTARPDWMKSTRMHEMELGGQT